MENILISIRPAFVEKIISGRKRVEIRRRRINIDHGDRLWIYSSLPSARVEVVSLVKSVSYGSPSDLWPLVSDFADISAEAYRSYLAGSNVACAIYLGEVKELIKPVSLHDIRNYDPRFQPPQFFHRLPEDSVLLKILDEAYAQRDAVSKP
jgi:predicted transcriptional regulator